jgi:hypothetical protein
VLDQIQAVQAVLPEHQVKVILVAVMFITQPMTPEAQAEEEALEQLV